MEKVKKRIYRVKAGFGPHTVNSVSKRKVINKDGEEETKFKTKRVKIKPGETFQAYPYDKSVSGWEHKLEVVESGTVVPPEEVKEQIEKEENSVVTTALKAIHKGSGKYDVINEETGEKINNKPLSKADAEKLLNGENVVEKKATKTSSKKSKKRKKI